MAGKPTKEDERQHALQHETDTTPLEGTPEVHDAGGAPQAPDATKKNGLPKDRPLRRSLTDTDLIVDEVTGEQYRRQWDTDEDGVEITDSETWVPVSIELGRIGAHGSTAAAGHESEETPVPEGDG